MQQSSAPSSCEVRHTRKFQGALRRWDMKIRFLVASKAPGTSTTRSTIPPQSPGVDQSHNRVPALKTPLTPWMKDPLYPHPHKAQQKLLGRLALPGQLFTSPRHTCITSTDLLHTSYSVQYAPFESLLDNCVDPVISITNQQSSVDSLVAGQIQSQQPRIPLNAGDWNVTNGKHHLKGDNRNC